MLKQYIEYSGLALVVIGASLLAVCYIAQRESNIELLTGLLLIVSGYVLHLWLQKRGNY